MREVGKFVISDKHPLDTFESRRQFDDMFNATYNNVKHALLWTDTIVANIDKSGDKRLFPWKKLMDHATNPVSLHEYKDRLASFPENLKFVAKKMALYFYTNGVSLESIKSIKGMPKFDPIIAVVIIAILHLFLIHTEHDDIFKRIYKRNKLPKDDEWGKLHQITHDWSAEFQVFSSLIEPSDGFTSAIDRVKRIYPIVKAAIQLSTMMGLSGYLNADSPQLDKVPQEQRQELIALLQDASAKVIIYVKIEDGPEPPPSEQVMSMIGSRRGGKRRKSSNHTQRRKKQHKKTVKR